MTQDEADALFWQHVAEERMIVVRSIEEEIENAASPETQHLLHSYLTRTLGRVEEALDRRDEAAARAH